MLIFDYWHGRPGIEPTTLALIALSQVPVISQPRLTHIVRVADIMRHFYDQFPQSFNTGGLKGSK